MTIISNLEGAGTIAGEGEYPYNTCVDVSAYAKQGYKFIGWYYQNTLLSKTNDYKYMMLSEDVTLEARFKSVSFLMNVHTSNQDYGLVLLKSRLNNFYRPEYQEYRDYTTQVTIVAHSKTDVRFLGWYDTDNKLVETNAVYNFVMPNYDYTLEAKWNYFTVSYVLNGGTNSFSNPKSYTIDSNKITLREPTRTGYDFAGWTYNGRVVTEIDPAWIENITLIAKWTANLNNLSITSEDTSKGMVVITSGSGYSDESITVVATPIGDCVFKGWYHESTKVSNDATFTFTMPTNDYTLVARFFTKAAAEEERAQKYGTKPLISADGKTLTYGLYPQKNVNDSTLVSALNTLTTQDSNGWYLYEGDYYAKFSTKNSGYFDNGTKFVTGTAYWFKCEPIVWNILSIDYDKYYIISSVLLDAHCYYNSILNRGSYSWETVYPNNYKYSDIRTWLNEDFYNSAFALGNSHIQTKTVYNHAYTTDSSVNNYACADTKDKVFLPSYKDYTYPYLSGFSTLPGPTNTRYCKTTDWARARGAYYSTSSSHLYNGHYWTRSPSSDPNESKCAWSVYCEDGQLTTLCVTDPDIGVRPGLSIKIA